VVPTSTSTACITMAGTYTVTLLDGGTVGTLTLGGASGTQTLTVQGTPGNDSDLTISMATGSYISPKGVFRLDTPIWRGLWCPRGGCWRHSPWRW
jgi:hypothetical protein